MKISACIICMNEQDLIRLCLESVRHVVDEIIVVDGGSTDKTLEVIDSINEPKVKVFHKRWIDNWGVQREFAARQATGDFILQIDADEVLGDTGFMLKEYAKKGFTNYDMKYEHFIWNLGLLDNTQPEHMGVNRFFINKRVRYPQTMHELATSNDFKKHGQIKDIVLWHLGYLRGTMAVVRKFDQHMKYSQMHTQEFLKKWKADHLLGTYPVKKFEGEYPSTIKRFML